MVGAPSSWRYPLRRGVSRPGAAVVTGPSSVTLTRSFTVPGHARGVAVRRGPIRPAQQGSDAVGEFHVEGMQQSDAAVRRHQCAEQHGVGPLLPRVHSTRRAGIRPPCGRASRVGAHPQGVWSMTDRRAAPAHPPDRDAAPRWCRPAPALLPARGPVLRRGGRAAAAFPRFDARTRRPRWPSAPPRWTCPLRGRRCPARRCARAAPGRRGRAAQPWPAGPRRGTPAQACGARRTFASSLATSVALCCQESSTRAW